MWTCAETKSNGLLRGPLRGGLPQAQDEGPSSRWRPKSMKEGPSPRRKAQVHKAWRKGPSPFSENLPVQISSLWRRISPTYTVGSSCIFDTRFMCVLSILDSNLRIIQPFKRQLFRLSGHSSVLSTFQFFLLLLFSMLHSPPYFHPSHHTIFVSFFPHY